MKPSDTNHYKFIQAIGEGKTAVVWLAQHTGVNRQVAVKVLQKSSQIENLRHIMQEVELGTAINCPYFVKYYDSFEDEENLYIVMEYLPNGSLAQLIRKDGALEEKRAKQIIYQVFKALDYIHDKKIIHRDLKAENILLAANNDIKIADFGVSTTLDKLNQSICGSPSYIAPELIKREVYGTAVDMWASGVLLYLMLTGDYPFKDDSLAMLCQKIVKQEIEIPQTLSSDLQNLLFSLLRKEPIFRILASEALAHPCFEDVENRMRVYQNKSMHLFTKKLFRDRMGGYHSIRTQKGCSTDDPIAKQIYTDSTLSEERATEDNLFAIRKKKSMNVINRSMIARSLPINPIYGQRSVLGQKRL